MLGCSFLLKNPSVMQCADTVSAGLLTRAAWPLCILQGNEAHAITAAACMPSMPCSGAVVSRPL